MKHSKKGEDVREREGEEVKDKRNQRVEAGIMPNERKAGGQRKEGKSQLGLLGENWAIELQSIPGWKRGEWPKLRFKGHQGAGTGK